MRFNVDRVFDMSTNQQEIYEVAALPIVESVMEGFNGTIFAYGQTSSGKTHTMQGVDINDEEMMGIIPRIVRHIFHQIDDASEDIEFTVKVSMIEIYMERIRDLLDPKKINLQVHEDKERGVFVGDVTETYVTESYEVNQIMRIGNENRSIGVTDMNKQSSRSHSCFIMTITQNNTANFQCKSGKLYLVDLAGSEKISKTGATGQTLNEAKKINKSLSTLGLVINSLTDGKSKHIPYRDSKLTRVLQESLGGNSKTCLIITCSPSVYNEAETISTLRFGQSAKKIKNKPKINKEFSVAELKKLLEEAELKIESKDRRIKSLEKLIKALGGDVPAEKDDFIKRKPQEKAKPLDKDEEEEEDEEEANEKIDAIENQSSDDELSDDESMLCGSRFDDSQIDDSLISSKRMTDSRTGESTIGDESTSNIADVTFDAPSDLSKSNPTHRANQKSQIEEINDTIAMLQKEADTQKKDAETMTEQPTYVSVKTNTNSATSCNIGTSVEVEYSSFEMMTDDALKELSESGIQTQSTVSTSLEVQTDPVEFSEAVDSEEQTPEEEKEQTSEEEKEQTPEKEKEGTLEKEELVEEKKDDLVERIDHLQKEFCENGIQTKTNVVDEEEYQKIVDELTHKNSEFASQSIKLSEILDELEEKKRVIEIKDKTLHEQLEEIEELSTKIKQLENNLSDVSDVKESQHDMLENQEKKITHLDKDIKSQEAKISEMVEKEIEYRG